MPSPIATPWRHSTCLKTRWAEMLVDLLEIRGWHMPSRGSMAVLEYFKLWRNEIQTYSNTTASDSSECKGPHTVVLQIYIVESIPLVTATRESWQQVINDLTESRKWYRRFALVVNTQLHLVSLKWTVQFSGRVSSLTRLWRLPDLQIIVDVLSWPLALTSSVGEIQRCHKSTHSGLRLTNSPGPAHIYLLKAQGNTVTKAVSLEV
jgi:hypothetical protein